MAFHASNNFDWHVCGMLAINVLSSILNIHHVVHSHTKFVYWAYFHVWVWAWKCLCAILIKVPASLQIFTLANKHSTLSPVGQPSNKPMVAKNMVCLCARAFVRWIQNLNIKKFVRKLLKLECAIVRNKIEQIKNSHFETVEWIWFWVLVVCVCAFFGPFSILPHTITMPRFKL